MTFIEKANLCKFSLEEAQLLSGKNEVSEACDFLHRVGTELITITLGAGGTFVSTKNGQQTVPSIAVNPVDTTGAGDAFIGCLLQQIATLKNADMLLENDDLLFQMVAKANKAGAITTTNYGAIESLPDEGQLSN